MIDYGKFQFASPPRTGTTWFMKAAALAGLGEGSKALVHIPPRTGPGSFVVSTSRHPFTWLKSYYYGLQGGSVGIPPVDVFSPFVKQSKSFEEFLRLYLNQLPGAVGQMFDVYQANSVMRLEDIKWAALEFFTSVGVRHERALQACSHPAQNATKNMPLSKDKQLFREVVRAEKDFCEAYGYV